MKSLFKSIMFVAAAAMTFTACDKGYNAAVTDEGATKLTIVAGNPATEVATRTQLGDDLVPMWLPSDQIGVVVINNENSYVNRYFNNDSDEVSQTTTFSGTVTTTGTTTVYTYYPYTSNGIAASGAAKVDLDPVQNPTATSFDGKSDIMVGKPVTLDLTSSQTIEGLQFKRVTAVVKVVLQDKTTSSSITGDEVRTVIVGASKDLAGRLYLNLDKEEALGNIYYNNSKTVTANYSSSTLYHVDGKAATYLSVYPVTLESGSTLTITVETDKHIINKEVELSQDVEFVAGKITTLNVAVEDEHVSVPEKGLDLPFTDDFTWASNSQTQDGTTAMNISEYPAGNYTATENTFKSANGIKFGTNTKFGYFTTTTLDLSEPFTVFVQASTWGSDTSNINVTVDETAGTAQSLTSDMKFYKFEFDAQTANSKVRVDVGGKRGYVRYLSVVKGHDVEAPAMFSITSGNTLAVSGNGGTEKVTYEIQSEHSGATIAAESSESWIHDFNYDTANEVSFTVDANEGDEREATITFTYADAKEQTVTVTQTKAGVAADKTVTYTVSSTSAVTTDGTAPSGSSAKYSQTYSTKEQLTANNSATLTLEGWEGKTIKALVLNMKSNAKAGAGKFSFKAGSATLAEITSNTYFSSWFDNKEYTATYKDIHVTLNDDSYQIQSGESVVVTITCSTNSLYIHSYTITYAD